MDMTIFPAFNRAIIIYLIIILVIAIYYMLSRIDSFSFTGTENTAIPIGVLFLLITNGFFMGNNGFTGDFGLDYCNDKDRYSGFIGGTEYVLVHPGAFFACELGPIDGLVDLGWNMEVSSNQYIYAVNTELKVMILNHDNYKNFVGGETYGVSNFHLSDLQASVTYSPDEEISKYKVGITLHSDTYFFVVDRGYGNTGPPDNANNAINRGLIGPNSPTGTSSEPLYFKYLVDLDYDTSGVITTD